MINKDIIEQLAAEELVDANTKHEPKFNSTHEAYAVLLEEVEEMILEVDAIKRKMLEMWTDIKADLPIVESLSTIHRRTIYAVQEGIQVVAMCDKALKLYE